MKRNKYVALLVILVIAMTSMCYAASWHTTPFEGTRGSSIGNVTPVVKEFDCTTIPKIDFWMNSVSSENRTVTVKLYNWDYIKVGTRYQWTWNLVETNTHFVLANKTPHFSYFANTRLSGKGKYEIIYTGFAATSFDAFVYHFY